MGRPIKKKYFGNLNYPYSNYANGGFTGVGGEGVASVTLSTTSLTVSTGSVVVLFAAPTVIGGIQATGTAVKTGNTVSSVIVTNPGSGYTAAPAVVFNATVGSTGTGVSVLTTNPNAIAGLAYLTTGSSAVAFDIIKQEASRRYLVHTAQGVGQCKLITTSTLTAGDMTIIATDSLGSTYYVAKLTAHHATLVQQTVNGSWEFVTNAVAGWTVNGASTGTVSIANN